MTTANVNFWELLENSQLASSLLTLTAQMQNLAVSVHSLAPLPQQMQSLSLSMLPVLEFVRYADVSLTPSVDCKSDNLHIQKYVGLMDVFAFPHDPEIIDGVEEDIDEAFRLLHNNNFIFSWNGQTEDVSYIPLQQYLQNIGIIAVVIGSGTGLPLGLLYNVDIYSLKQNLTIRSDELRQDGSEPKMRFHLKGRTDLVVLRRGDVPLGNGNIKYYIEVKTISGMNRTAIKEAILQLIGGNVAALYHSPPVLLTNLNQNHYVLYIDRVGDDHLSFKLRIKKWTALCNALAFVEARTQSCVCTTRDFGRMPTPPPSAAGSTALENQAEIDLEDLIT
jgi:hypothetical protein